jgi:alginate O-acetyltransferase complex protein AlgI
MLFNSAPFAALLAATLVAYWSTRVLVVRLAALLVASFTFYAWRHWPSLFLLLATIGFNYVLGRLLESKRSGRLLAFGIAVNLSALGWFKYSAFVAANVQALLSTLGVAVSIPQPPAWLPLGISFFTFQVIAYLVDVYRGELKAERSLLVFAVFKSFFAQLVAGPIVRGRDMLPQLKEVQRFDAAAAHRGLFLLIAGLFLKSAVADVIGQFAQAAFAAPEQQSTLGAWLGLYAFSAQLLADFWGYSTMAIGAGLLFGLRLPKNFDTPYVSRRLQEFWRRWHITLGAWFRDYLYLPLGGNRRRALFNVFFVMAVAGLWHGAGWTFVLWGVLHGLWLVLERLFASKPTESRWRAAVERLLVFHGVALLWVLFNAKTLEIALRYYGRLLLPPWDFGGPVPEVLAIGLLGFALLHRGLDRLMEGGRFAEMPLKAQLLLCAGMLLLLLGYGGAKLDFIYFVF